MNNELILKTDIVDIDYLKNILGMLCWYNPKRNLHVYITILSKLNIFWDILIVSDEYEIKLLKNAIKLATNVRIKSKDLSFVRNEVITTYPELKDLIESMKNRINIFSDILNDLLAKYKSFVAMKFTKDLQYSLYNVMSSNKDVIDWYNEINKLIQEFYNEAQLDVNSTEIKYIVDEIDERIDNRINDLISKADRNSFIKSSLQLFNYVFANKVGYEKGCVYMFGAPTGGGKTRFCVMEGAYMYQNGFNVCHITIENNELKISDLYDSCLLGISTDELYNIYKKSMSNEEAKNKINEIKNNLKKAIKERELSKLVIKKFRPLSVTPLMIENYLLTLISEGEKPDVLIVDHVDLLLPNSMKREDLFRTGEEVVAQMKDIAERFNVVLLLPTHVNREGNKKKKKKNPFDDVISRGEIARSGAKYELVDMFATINRIVDEKFTNKMRLYVDKNRDGIEDVIIPCEFDLGSMKMRTLTTMEEIDLYKNSVIIPKSMALLFYRACLNENDRNLYIDNLIEFSQFLPYELKEKAINLIKESGCEINNNYSYVQGTFLHSYDFINKIINNMQNEIEIKNIEKNGNQLFVIFNNDEIIYSDIDKLQDLINDYEESEETDKVEYEILYNMLKEVKVII